MEQKAGSHLSDDPWFRILWREVIRSKDFAGALIGFVIGFAVSLDNPSIRDSAEAFLIAIGALAIALAGFVGAVLAVITAWFDEIYRRVLAKAGGGWRGAMRPYKITAILGLVTALFATVSLFIWSIANPQLQSLLLALTLALFIWTVGATIQIIGITFFHGQMRDELLKGMAEARRTLAARRKHKQAG
jgi:hypothetical protein